MTVTPTARNRIARQGTGDNTGTWGAVLNAQALDLIDQALDGLSVVAVNANLTLTSVNYASDQARSRVLKFTGVGGFTVTLPGVEKFYIVHNTCAASVLISTGAGSVASIPASQITFVYCDAVNVYIATPGGSGSFLTPITITATASQALVVGPNGVTNPSLTVDTSTASATTGLVVTARAAGNGALLSVLSSGANEDFYINAKGSGAIRLATASTGNLLFGNVVLNRATSAISGLGTIASGAHTITSADSQALAVGPSGGGNPSFQVNASVPSAATGIGVTAEPANGGVDIAAISSSPNESLTLNAKGSGTISVATSSTGNIALGNVIVNRSTNAVSGIGSLGSGAHTVTSSGSQALVVGPSGAASPSFQVNSATASAATGLGVTAAAPGGGADLSAISSGTNENLTINAKGSGTITLASASTGAIRIGNVSVAPATGKIALGGGAGFAGDYLTGVSPNIVAGFDCSAGGGTGQALTLNRTGSDGGAAGFYRSGASVGSISVTATTTAYNTTSDYRTKGNVRALTGSGAFIDALLPRQWDWIADGSAGAGFIAHEAQAVSPSSVTGQKDAIDAAGNPVLQGMMPGSPEIIANLVAELQALRARVAVLEAR